MAWRRVILMLAFVAVATSFYTIGVMQTRGDLALHRVSQDARIDAIQTALVGRRGTARTNEAQATGTAGSVKDVAPATGDANRLRLVEQVKQEIQNEMGLLSVRLMRERRSSFVELHSEDNFGRTSYGTAGYLGRGYFVTVKHAVTVLPGDKDRDGKRRIVGIHVLYQGGELPAQLVDTGDADVEVHRGDWAIIRTREVDLPALHPNPAFAFDFAEPIFRFGNDYSKGVIVSTGYVGQRMATGLVTALTDGHPGVSGGGVLDRRGDLVGIPIGRMDGDYRFSFILPIRPEILRSVPPAGGASAGVTPAVPPGGE